ncbi:hypothetical protein Gotri_025965 [Gossypium trilobum]|uniref:DUF7745 domain-containing protein n=1 Tax=Gossypium trilobum TaxID=34281 RepID=A0A7J9FSR4_9ROSI|nr:hypothetical protein [Gossypium trilobum]
MEREFLGKVEDNAAVRVWSKKVQQEKGDSLVEGYVSELWDFTRISVIQNNLQELKEIWDQWGDEIKQLFYSNYGDLPYLLDVKLDKHLFRALTQYWNPAYSCFTFGKVDLVPTVEEYTTLLRCPRIQVDRAYSKAVYVPTFLKKLMSITGMSEQWEKGIFPKALGHVDEVVSDLFDRLDKRVTPVPVILAETFRSLNACKRAENYSPLKELVATPRRDDITEEKWMMILQNLKEEDVEWRAPWMIPNEILYRCGEFDWVPLLGIWGAVGYAPLLVLSLWWERRINDNIPVSSQEDARPMAEHLQLEEEKIRLGLDVDIHRLEAEKLRKGKNKAEEDLDSLKVDYKKLRLLIRTAGLGKTSEQ